MNARVASRIRKWAHVIAEYKAIPKAGVEKNIKEQWKGLPVKDRSYFAEQMDVAVKNMKHIIAKRSGRAELGNDELEAVK